MRWYSSLREQRLCHEFLTSGAENGAGWIVVGCSFKSSVKPTLAVEELIASWSNLVVKK